MIHFFHDGAGQFQYKGTAAEFLLRDRKLWGLIAWAGFWRILREVGIIPEQELGDSLQRTISLIGTVTAFVLSFFLNQTYCSFRDQGRGAKAIPGRMYEFTFVAKGVFYDHPKLLSKLLRLLCASFYVYWMDMAGTYAWKDVLHRGLLSEEEKKLLCTLKSKKCYTLLHWMNLEMESHFRSLSETPPTIANLIYKRDLEKMQMLLFEVRRRYSELDRHRVINIPLVYSNYVWWLVVWFLALVGFYSAVSVESNNPGTGLFGYLILVVGFVGVLDISLVLREPFGTDSTDIDPFFFLSSAMKNITSFTGDTGIADVPGPPSGKFLENPLWQCTDVNDLFRIRDESELSMRMSQSSASFTGTHSHTTQGGVAPAFSSSTNRDVTV